MSQPMSALISMNAFKGRLSNAEACDIVSAALKKKDIRYRILPVGDGGAGTLLAVHSCLGGDVVPLSITGPLGKRVEARVLCLPNDKAPTVLYVESAEAVGFHLTDERERDPMRASSLGLGELLAQAFEKWGKSLTKIYVGLGDSGISDMGMGMLCGLGFTFLDHGGKSLWGNADGLRSIRTLRVPSLPYLHKLEFVILCDVMNPLLGPTGSARVFSPQKGATPGQVRLIEQGMEHFATLIRESTGRNLKSEPMGGSAGGLAAAFYAFFNARLVRGAPFLMDLIHYDRILAEHAFIITGEGKTDSQTLSGKAPFECLLRAERLGKKVVFLSGALGEGHESLLRKGAVAGMFACGDEPNSRDALYERALALFSDPAFLEALA